MSYDSYDDTLFELRREAAAERRRNRPHWCSECHGFTQKGSPCYVEPEETETEESEQ